MLTFGNKSRETLELLIFETSQPKEEAKESKGLEDIEANLLNNC